MKNTRAGFVGISIAILVVLALAAGGAYYVTERDLETKSESKVLVQESEQDSKQDIKQNVEEEGAKKADLEVYSDTQFDVSFVYPTNEVSVSNENVFTKNSGRFVNFDIKSGGDFSFDILEDSNRMVPSFATEFDEFKFKMKIGWDDIAQYSQLTLNGRAAYRVQVYAKGYNDTRECAYDKIVTKKDGYWFEFLAKVCDGDVDASIKTFESIAATLTFEQ